MKGKTAWLITKHWIDNSSKKEIVVILSSRLRGSRVREFIELLSLTSGSFTLSEQLSYAWPRHGRLPYAATFGQTVEGFPWDGEVFCGNDPYLKARLVDNLKIERNPDGREDASWKERPRPSIPWRQTEELSHE